MTGAIAAQAELNLDSALHGVVRLLLDRPDLQERLGAEYEANSFMAALLAVAAEHEVPCPEPALRAALRPDPLGLGRFAPAPVALRCWPGPGWLPARSVPAAEAPEFDWLWFGPAKLTAPFFEDEVRRVSALPLNWLLRSRTTLDQLRSGHTLAAAGESSLPLRGLIFHLSRCGSTLLSQMLGARADTATCSEPEPLDAVLRWIAATQPAPAAADAALRAMIAALGRRQGSGDPDHFVLKLEVWHSLFLPELRRALPAVPWLYLRRDPVEVLVSQLAQPSIHIIPGALDAARLALEGDPGPSHAGEAARVLGRCAAAIAEHWPLGGGRVMDYPDLVSSGAEDAARHFGLPQTAAAAAAMAQAAQRDAKVPYQAFTSDSARKQAEATDEVRVAAASWMSPALAAIDQLG